MSDRLRQPYGGPTVWSAADVAARADWRYELDRVELTELDGALVHAKATGKPLAAIGREDFPLESTCASIARWMEVLQRGPGFINVRGLAADRYSDEDLGLIHWGIGLHMGNAVSQNAAGDLLSHVRDVGANPYDRGKRLYKTRAELGFHSDGSDLVGLLCIRPAKFGGANRLASCGAIYNEVLLRRPDLVDLLYQPFYWDRNNEESPGEDPFFPLPICSYQNGLLRFFYIGWYIRNAQRHAAVPRLSAEQVQLLDLIDEVAADPLMHVEFRLDPGEINYLKNSAVLHMRTGFEDHAEDSRKRHMVRLWLTAHGGWSDGDAFVQQGIPVKKGAVSDAEDMARSGPRG
jgi:hypothetical protein